MEEPTEILDSNVRQQAMLCIVALRFLPHRPYPRPARGGGGGGDSGPENTWVGKTGKVWELDWRLKVAKSMVATSFTCILRPGGPFGNLLGHLV